MHQRRGVVVLAFSLWSCGGGGGGDPAPIDGPGPVDAPFDALPDDAGVDAPPPTAPAAPTNVAATWGDGAATLTWDAPASDGGTAITEYVIRNQVTDEMTSAPASPFTVTGLNNGDSYAFVVRARNAVGDGPESEPSPVVIPAGLPDAPYTPSATPGAASGTVALSWSEGDSNGRPIVSYTITSNPDNLVRTTPTSATSYVFGGLRNGINYRFRVVANTEAGASPPSPASNAVQAVLPVCTGTVTYTALPSIPVGTTPIALAAGDLNANTDSFRDLVVSNNGSNTVQVLLSDGAGAWTVGAPIAVGAQPRGLAVEDFNGDGHEDIAVASWGTNSVQVLTGDGNGTFTAGPALAVGTNPTSVVGVDANRDGRLDLIVTNFNGGSASIILASASGGWNAATTLTTYMLPYAIAAADLDRNGYADDLVIGHGTANAAQLISNGNGTYGTATALPYNTNQHGILLEDLDLDGHVDLVQSSTTNSTIQVRMRTSSGFGAGVTYNVSNEPKSISSGDFDGDGDTDLVVSNRSGGSFSVLRAIGNDTFSTAVTVSVGAGSFPWSVVAADVDSDTDEDIVVARAGNNDVLVYRVGCTP